ncbi:MAG TPA: DUF3102 domain-containing protein [Coleofasciculaceae cyanobacterium]|jgi:hypothetical protein
MKKKLKNNQISNSFDYNVLELEQRSIVKQRTEEIKERLKRSAQDIWEIGQKLFEVRSELAYGQFDSWLKAEFGWSRRTAYNFVKVYEAFPERATVAQVSIAASALYQLSSPSTPKQVREEFIQKAKDGEKITRKDIRLAAKQEKPSLALNATVTTEKTATSQQQIISIIPQATKAIKILAEQSQDSDDLSDSVEPELRSQGWYSLGEQHFLFYGDTASPQFYQNIPEADLAIAITSSDWDHDWLVDKVENLLLLKESSWSTKSLSTLISLLCEPDGTVLFPWLPDENMIDSAHKLGRIIVAGDPILERCQKAIAKSKLTPKLISPLEKL